MNDTLNLQEQQRVDGPAEISPAEQTALDKIEHRVINFFTNLGIHIKGVHTTPSQMMVRLFGQDEADSLGLALAGVMKSPAGLMALDAVREAGHTPEGTFAECDEALDILVESCQKAGISLSHSLANFLIETAVQFEQGHISVAPKGASGGVATASMTPVIEHEAIEYREPERAYSPAIGQGETFAEGDVKGFGEPGLPSAKDLDNIAADQNAAVNTEKKPLAEFLAEASAEEQKKDVAVEGQEG